MALILCILKGSSRGVMGIIDYDSLYFFLFMRHSDVFLCFEVASVAFWWVARSTHNVRVGHDLKKVWETLP